MINFSKQEKLLAKEAILLDKSGDKEGALLKLQPLLNTYPNKHFLLINYAIWRYGTQNMTNSQEFLNSLNKCLQDCSESENGQVKSLCDIFVPDYNVFEIRYLYNYAVWLYYTHPDNFYYKPKQVLQYLLNSPLLSSVVTSLNNNKQAAHSNLDE